LNESQIVRPDGRISLQLISEITAAGLKPSELTTVLEERYANELEKPEIAVIVRSFNGQRFFVDGEVSRPGLFTLIGPTTVLDSIAQAGGFRDTARKHEIVVIRQGVDKKPMVLQVNLNKVVDGTDMSQNLVIQPYDIVYVPKSAIANVNMFVDQYIRKNIPISLSLGYYLNNEP
jgi:protein involved in polysaccharide export with SLBB domain